MLRFKKEKGKIKIKMNLDFSKELTKRIGKPKWKRKLGFEGLKGGRKGKERALFFFGLEFLAEIALLEQRGDWLVYW